MMVLSLGACGGSQRADVPQAVTSATVDLASIDPEILQATDILEQQCARSKGFDVQVEYTVPPIAQGYADAGGIFRSEQEAVNVGYSRYTVNFDDKVASNEDFVKRLSPSEQQRYKREVTGSLDDATPDPTTCLAQANTIMFGSMENAEQVLNTFNDLVRGQDGSIVEDKRVTDAIVHEYMPCMADAGYAVQGLNAGALAKERFGMYRKWNEKPKEQERAMARQDFLCQDKAGLMRKMDDAMQEHVGKWMLQNEAMLLHRHEILQSALSTANEIIAGKYSYDTYLAESSK